MTSCKSSYGLHNFMQGIFLCDFVCINITTHYPMPLLPSIFPAAYILQPGCLCFLRCQDVQHQVASSSAAPHQLATSLLHSIFPADCMLMPGCLCFPRYQDVQNQAASCSTP